MKGPAAQARDESRGLLTRWPFSAASFVSPSLLARPEYQDGEEEEEGGGGGGVEGDKHSRETREVPFHVTQPSDAFCAGSFQLLEPK